MQELDELDTLGAELLHRLSPLVNARRRGRTACADRLLEARLLLRPSGLLLESLLRVRELALRPGGRPRRVGVRLALGIRASLLRLLDGARLGLGVLLERLNPLAVDLLELGRVVRLQLRQSAELGLALLLLRLLRGLNGLDPIRLDLLERVRMVGAGLLLLGRTLLLGGEDLRLHLLLETGALISGPSGVDPR